MYLPVSGTELSKQHVLSKHVIHACLIHVACLIEVVTKTGVTVHVFYRTE